jgi:hypothetical protein
MINIYKIETNYKEGWDSHFGFCENNAACKDLDDAHIEFDLAINFAKNNDYTQDFIDSIYIRESICDEDGDEISSKMIK